jgi:hypothetical protein
MMGRNKVMKTVRYRDSDERIRDGLLDGYTIDFKNVLVWQDEKIVKVPKERVIEIKEKRKK